MSRRLVTTLGAAPVVVKVYKDTDTYGYVARLYLDGVEHEPASYEDSDLEGVKHTAADMLARSQAHRALEDARAVPKFDSAAALDAAVRDARGDCLDALRRDADTARLWLVSRGAWVRVLYLDGTTNEADSWEFKGTQAEFAELLRLRTSDTAAGVYIEGGFNAAETGADYAQGSYDPWVGEWSVALWSKDDEPEAAPDVPKWIAGWNMPGYMPDSEPAEFDTFDEAKRYIIGELKRDEDDCDIEHEAEQLCAFAEDVNLQSGEFSAQCLRHVYWVTRA